jgi:HPt (histidine-containing phosphotransfer) domain-containing protein
LGQVALNDDQFSAAIEDLKSALEIVNAHFAEDYREIAFIDMELARVYRKTNDYSAANLHTDNAIQSLEKLKGKCLNLNITIVTHFSAKLEAEPQNDDGKLLAEIQGFIDEVLDERNVTRVRECEGKENAVTREPANLDEKPSEILVIKRKEKRSAEDQIDVDEAKKPKVDELLTES